MTSTYAASAALGHFKNEPHQLREKCGPARTRIPPVLTSWVITVVSEVAFRLVSRLQKTAVGDERAFHCAPEYLVAPGFRAYAVRKGSPLRAPFNAFVLRVLQAGLYDWWVDVIDHHMVTYGIMVPRREAEREPRALTAAQLLGPVLLLGFGQAAAAAAFAAECAWVRLRRAPRRRAQRALRGRLAASLLSAPLSHLRPINHFAPQGSHK